MFYDDTERGCVAQYVLEIIVFEVHISCSSPCRACEYGVESRLEGSSEDLCLKVSGDCPSIIFLRG